MDFDNISFSKQSIFGTSFNPSLKSMNCDVGFLVNNGFIEPTGSISIESVKKINKSQIWNYIFYLWYHNRNNIMLFKEMSTSQGTRTTASPSMFAKHIYDLFDKTSGDIKKPMMAIFTKQRLVNAIIKVVQENKSIKIPFLKHLYSKLIDTDIPMKPIEIQSKQPNVKINLDQVKLITNDKYNAKLSTSNNPNVKVQFGINLVSKK